MIMIGSVWPIAVSASSGPFICTACLRCTEQDVPVSMISLTPDTSAHPKLPPDLVQYYKRLDFALFITEQRMRNGEANAEGYVWLDCALARVDALISHKDADAAVLSVAIKATHHTASIAREAYFAETGVQIDLSQDVPSAGKDHGREDRTDDVTSERFRGQSSTGDIGTANESAEDRDWQILMSGGWMDLGWDMSESPDNWFG